MNEIKEGVREGGNRREARLNKKRKKGEEKNVGEERKEQQSRKGGRFLKKEQAQDQN